MGLCIIVLTPILDAARQPKIQADGQIRYESSQHDVGSITSVPMITRALGWEHIHAEIDVGIGCRSIDASAFRAASIDEERGTINGVAIAENRYGLSELKEAWMRASAPGSIVLIGH